MRRWAPAFLFVLLLCIPVILSRGTSAEMLQDSDTKVLLEGIRARQNPLSWFTGDWPLQNHFYRPISTLAFEMDNALYGNNAAGYGWTNVLLCVACILLTFWVIRELTDKPDWAAGVAGLYALWHLPTTPGVLSTALTYFSWAILAVGVIRHRLEIRQYVPAFLVCTFLASEANGVVNLQYRMIDWLPGRTASVMTVFALASMAAYARYERLSAKQDAPKPLTPLDPPATRSTVAAVENTKPAWPWAILAIVCLVLALGSYEQAIMLPAALFGVSMSLRLRGYRVRWAWQAPFWLLLVGYLALRYQIIPRETSGYQAQQFRSGPGVWLDLSTYAIPFASGLPSFIAAFDPLLLATAGPYQFLCVIGSNVATFVAARKVWVLALTGWALSFFTFLPMAWLKTFDHYHYWPMAMRALMFVALSVAARELIINACSPKRVQAPVRANPAPGSL